jgi:hypothetical protein
MPRRLLTLAQEYRLSCWRVRAGVVLNPPQKDKRRAWSTDDQIIVLAED